MIASGAAVLRVDEADERVDRRQAVRRIVGEDGDDLQAEAADRWHGRGHEERDGVLIGGTSIGVRRGADGAPVERLAKCLLHQRDRVGHRDERADIGGGQREHGVSSYVQYGHCIRSAVCRVRSFNCSRK